MKINHRSSLILVFKNSYIRLIMTQCYFYKVVINTVTHKTLEKG